MNNEPSPPLHPRIQKCLGNLHEALKNYGPKNATAFRLFVNCQGVEEAIFECKNPAALKVCNVSMRNLRGEWIEPTPETRGPKFGLTLQEWSAYLWEHYQGLDVTITTDETNPDGSQTGRIKVDGRVVASWGSHLANPPVYDGKTPRGPSLYCIAPH